MKRRTLLKLLAGGTVASVVPGAWLAGDKTFRIHETVIWEQPGFRQKVLEQVLLKNALAARLMAEEMGNALYQVEKPD